jgi:hypothetical protein
MEQLVMYPTSRERFSGGSCVICGFVPYEAVERYLQIHGNDAACIVCKNTTVGAVEILEVA